MNAQQVLKLKEIVADKEREYAELIGRRKTILSNIREEFGVESVGDLRKKVESRQLQRKELDTKLKEKMDILENKLSELGVVL